MLSRVWILVLLCLGLPFVSQGAAEAADLQATPETTAALIPLDFISGPPVCARTAAGGGLDPQPLSCDADATCDGGLPISCHESGSGTCQGVDQNCSIGLTGFVRCGISTTYCDPPCPSCEEPPACTHVCSVHSDCDSLCSCGPGLCHNGGCSPAAKKFCFCA